MRPLGAYIFSVVCAAAVVSVAGHFSKTGKISQKLVGVVCGIFMAFTVISILIDFDVGDLGLSLETFSESGQYAAAMGEEISSEALAELISEKLTAYIITEADKMGVTVDAEVSLDNTTPPIPKTISITGQASPYEQNILTNHISEELGISQENIIWNGRK